MKHHLLLFVLFLLLPKVATYATPYSPAFINRYAADQDTINTDSVNTRYKYIPRSQVTGAISTITPEQLQQVPVFSVDQALKGRVAGVQVTQNSGVPGAAASVRVRGVSTLFSSAEPLYVLDGVPLLQSATENIHQFTPVLDFINPADIASVEILKDAGAAAIYGSWASNGVVLITTKRGQAKTNQVTLHSYFGLQQVPKQIPLLNAREYTGLINEIFQERGQVLKYTPEQIKAFGAGTDWQSEIYRLAPLQNHQVSYSGGSAAHRVFASAGYTNQQGVVIQSGLQRYNFRLNYDGQISQRFKVGISSLVSTIKNRPTDPNSTRSALLAPPIWTLKDDAAYLRNPVEKIKQNTILDEGKLLWGSAFAEYQLLSGLFVKINYGITDTKQEINQDSKSIFAFDPGFTRYVASYNNKLTQAEATLHYRKSWRKHFLSLWSGHTSQLTSTITTQKNSRSPDGKVYQITGEGGSTLAANWMSYMGQLQYNFAERYFLSATVRRDGSPYFSSQKKYSLSPAIAMAWQAVKNESGSFVNSLKVRTSYGRTSYAYLPTNIYQNFLTIKQSLPQSNYYPIGNSNGSPPTGYKPGVIEPDLSPEKTRQVNFGADVSFLSNRVQLTADIYRRQTVDAILILPHGPGGNTTYSLSNKAGIRNQGLELGINSINLKNALTWQTAFIVATNHNKITSLKDLTGLINNNLFYLTAGKPVTSFYGYKTDGLYQTEKEITNGQSPGHIKFQDLNDDGKVSNDQTIIGNAQPTFIYSLDNNFTFRNFEGNIFLQGVQGNSIYNTTREVLDNFSLGELPFPQNGSQKTLNHWSKNRTNTSMPGLNGYAYNRQTSDYYIENGSFLRVRNVTLAYNLPQKLTISNKMLQAKVYISGQNLFTFTRYSGYDPEVGGLKPAEQGLDLYNYPTPRTYLAGIKITW